MGSRSQALSPADDDALDAHARGGLIVEHYRLDPTRQLWSALGLGSLVMAIGSLVAASALFLSRSDAERPVHARAMRMGVGDGVVRVGQVTEDGAPVRRGSMWWELGLGALGIASICAGGGVAIVRLNRVLREERYLALRTDGAYFQAGDERALVKWEDVATVRWDEPSAAVLFERHDGEPWRRAERYAGIDGPGLAKRAAEVRRKALFGLL
ncbi:MAG TPA: hypothetical protein RMH99_23455 [Sandaracinaceae bacterium LLY-WYZ-13_1]|nr:hypothetical protein [Sandaracinaceae bacterium LLY-WYZ-13_1]